jgi:hypothetical protein
VSNVCLQGFLCNVNTTVIDNTVNKCDNVQRICRNVTRERNVYFYFVTRLALYLLLGSVVWFCSVQLERNYCQVGQPEMCGECVCVCVCVGVCVCGVYVCVCVNTLLNTSIAHLSILLNSHGTWPKWSVIIMVFFIIHNLHWFIIFSVPTFPL